MSALQFTFKDTNSHYTWFILKRQIFFSEIIFTHYTPSPDQITPKMARNIFIIFIFTAAPLSWSLLHKCPVSYTRLDNPPLRMQEARIYSGIFLQMQQ